MKLNIPRWIILHHTNGSKIDREADTSHHTIKEVDSWHRQRNFIRSATGHYCGYHYFITKSGELTQGRYDYEEGCHCIGMNTSSIGIGLAGNFSRGIWKENHQPTEAQEKTLQKLLVEKMKEHGIPVSHIVPHRFFSARECYGKNLDNEWGQRMAKTGLEKENEISEEVKIKFLKKQITILEQLIRLYIQLLNFLKGRN